MSTLEWKRGTCHYIRPTRDLLVVIFPIFNFVLFLCYRNDGFKLSKLNASIMAISQLLMC